MTPQQRKGSQWERDVVAYLAERGYEAERCYGAGRSNDIGDVRGVPGVAIEAKNHRQLALSEWVGEARVEALNRGPDYVGVVVVKRRLAHVSQAYAVMTLADFVTIEQGRRQ